MKILTILLLLCALWLPVYAQLYPEHNIYDADRMPASFFKSNREQLMKMLGDSSIVVLYAAGEHTRNNDVDYKYRQSDDFYYLTGCNEPNSIVIVSSNGFSIFDTTGQKFVHEVLLVEPRDSMHESWTGKRLGPEGAMKVLGFEYGISNEELSTTLRRALVGTKKLFIPLPPEEAKEPLSKFIGEITTIARNVEQYRTISDPIRAIRTMRDVKSAEELKMMRTSASLTKQGHLDAMRACKPGMYEYQLQAEFEHAVTTGGGEYVAYPCIVGAGENSTILHYETNRRQLQNGDMVVMDCGAEYHNYACDVTRTIPVNGTFTKEQREIYELVLKAQQEAMKEMKPGVKYFDAPTKTANTIIQSGLLRLGIIKDSSDWRKYFNHGLGHPVGLAVHDVSIDGMLRANQVWTVEPGIYIPAHSPGVDPKYWNIGIRIEDEVLIIENGVSVLTDGIPKTIDEVEKAMRGR